MKKIVIAASLLLGACGPVYENADLEGCKVEVSSKSAIPVGKVIVKDGYVYVYSNSGACIKEVGELDNVATWHEDEILRFCYEEDRHGDGNLPSDPEEAKCSVKVEGTPFCDGAENTPVYRCSAPDITAADLGW